jgi:hypothetical protein
MLILDEHPLDGFNLVPNGRSSIDSRLNWDATLAGHPGTRLGNWVPDHQLPSAISQLGRPQRLYPQCLDCSLRQGGWITNHNGNFK